MRDRALILPLVGLLLLTPPLLNVFELDASLAGVPVTLIYVFSVWAGLILAAAALARPLAETEEAEGLDPTRDRRDRAP
jgi:hypothetical protein